MGPEGEGSSYLVYQYFERVLPDFVGEFGCSAREFKSFPVQNSNAEIKTNLEIADRVTEIETNPEIADQVIEAKQGLNWGRIA